MDFFFFFYVREIDLYTIIEDTLLETRLAELQEVPVWSENEWPGYLASIARYCSIGATYGVV